MISHVWPIVLVRIWQLLGKWVENLMLLSGILTLWRLKAVSKASWRDLLPRLLFLKVAGMLLPHRKAISIKLPSLISVKMLWLPLGRGRDQLCMLWSSPIMNKSWFLPVRRKLFLPNFYQAKSKTKKESLEKLLLQQITVSLCLMMVLWLAWEMESLVFGKVTHVPESIKNTPNLSQLWHKDQKVVPSVETASVLLSFGVPIYQNKDKFLCPKLLLQTISELFHCVKTTVEFLQEQEAVK